MKLVKTLLLTTAAVVAFNASAKSHFEGTFVGAQLGTSKAGSTKGISVDTSSLPTGATVTLGSQKKSNQWGLNGGLLVGHRTAVAQDVILGVSLGVDLESTKTKLSLPATGTGFTGPLTPLNGTDTLKTEVKRQYIVNLLGQAGYTVTKDVLVFATAGLSFTQFKFSARESDSSNSKKKNKFGYVVGAGASYAINETVSADLQYLYTGYGKTKVIAEEVSVSAPKAYHTVTVGVKVNI